MHRNIILYFMPIVNQIFPITFFLVNNNSIILINSLCYFLYNNIFSFFISAACGLFLRLFIEYLKHLTKFIKYNKMLNFIILIIHLKGAIHEK